MAKEKLVTQNPESAVETLTETPLELVTSNDVITQNDVIVQNDVVETEVEQVTTPEVIDQSIAPEPEAELIETSTPEVIDQTTILPLPEDELIETSTPELNNVQESQLLDDEAPVKAKIISMTVRPTGSFVM